MRLRNYWRSLKFLARTVRRSTGKYPRECTLCGYRGKFLGYGYPYMCDILCPKCGTLERHRLLCLANREHDFFRNRDVLHFAPEQAIQKLVLDHRPRSYTTADLFAPGVDLKENIEALTLDDKRFDLVICLHVLEHVNDRKAASELFRVLKPGGILLAMFPIVEGWDSTFEELRADHTRGAPPLFRPARSCPVFWPRCAGAAFSGWLRCRGIYRHRTPRIALRSCTR